MAEPDPDVVAKIAPEGRVPMPVHDGAKRRRNWDEVRKGFTEEQAIARGLALPGLRHLQRVHGVRARLRPRRPAARRARLASIEVEVGAVVMATGYDPYDPGAKSEYGYRRYPNVLSALEYERMLSASGPTMGEVKRASDDRHPKKIAFIQCVGSRDQDHEYCSSVCCMYANKQAMLTIDHVPDCKPTSSSWTCAPRARASTPSTSAPWARA